MPPLRDSGFALVLLVLAALMPGVADAQVSGTVRDSATLQPIAGAIVTLQGTSTRTTTDGAGGFSLPGVSGSSLVIVAANKGYYHGPSIVTTPATGLVYDLVAVPVMDNPNYTWVTNTSCSFCHTDQFNQYSGTPMQDTGDNLWVYDLYNGTGTAGGMGGFVYTQDSVHAATFPEGECASCHQPQHWINAPFSALEPIGAQTVDGQAGVSCDVCHKVADVNLAQVNATGFHAGAVTVTRPDAPGGVTQQVMYGPLGDVDYVITDAMNPSYQPGIETTTCAVCHQYNSDPDQDQNFDEPGSISGQSTYAEWLASPYGANPAAPTYQTCADCHMPAANNDGCVVLPVTREAGQIRSHDIRGTTPEYLENAVTMTVTSNVVGSDLQVQVDVENDQTGHAVPGGVSIRNMVLVVEAVRISDGMVLNHTGSQTVHALGGVGNPAQGYYSGLPGKLFAKVLEDGTGAAPVLFTEATAVQFDTRILPLATDTTNYTFAIPANTGGIEVRARLIYRRAFRVLVDAKNWTVTGHGDPLADIQAPHYGHLMEDEIDYVLIDNNDCIDAFPVTEGTIAFDNTGATTDGPNEPSACNFFGYSDVGADIWYRYTASCSGTVSIGLCGSGYDTKLAVYDGVACPTSASAIICNDDACSGTLQSEVSFTAVQGMDYLIRIGGYQSATGTGDMTISAVCDCQPITNETCVSSGADIVLGWNNGEVYDDVTIYRDGVLVATVGGSVIGYVDAQVPSGTYTYTIEGVCSGGPNAMADCTLTHVAGPSFQRTDCNDDGSKNLTDAILLLNVLFPLSPPGPSLNCVDACDCNDDGNLAIADAVCILVSLFGTPPFIPPGPLNTCGEDPTNDALSCGVFNSCP
ncbi:MAG: carboxypeptidase regulatory-like domain-containing protein [Planctomycetota bacterium]